MRVKHLGFALLFCLISLLSGCNPLKSKADTDKAVAVFHADFDSEDYDKIYDASHAGFKSAGSREAATNFMRSVHAKLGKVQSTTLIGWQSNSMNLETSIVLKYTTKFEHGTGEETFTYRIENGTPILFGWHINSNDLIMASSSASK